MRQHEGLRRGGAGGSCWLVGVAGVKAERDGVYPPPPPCTPPPRVTFRLVVAPLRGPGQSPVLPFACCVGSLRSVSRCGRCSCRCRFRIRGAQSSVWRGCAECGGMCRFCVSGAQWLVCQGCAGCSMVCRLRVPPPPHVHPPPPRDDGHPPPTPGGGVRTSHNSHLKSGNYPTKISLAPVISP